VGSIEPDILQFPGDKTPACLLDAKARVDARLLFSIADEDSQSLAELYRRHGQCMYALLTRMLGNDAEAEEVLQDVFLEIWRRAAEYDPRRSSPLAWIMLITRSRAVDCLRARGRRRANHAAYEEEVASLDLEVTKPRHVENNELAAACSAALNQLPENQSQVLELAFFRGWTHERIASSTGEPLGTVKARIRRGLLALRALLKEFRYE